jgi:hypothetical protein
MVMMMSTNMKKKGMKNMTRIRHQTKTRTLMHTTGKGKMEKGSKD